MDYAPLNIFTLDELTDVTTLDKTIPNTITIRGEHLNCLIGVEKISGGLGICDSSLQSLGELREILGGLWTSSHTVFPQLKSLENLQNITGDLQLRYSAITDLGRLKVVGGNVSLRDTPIENLGNLEFVGGNLLLPKRLEGKLDISKVKVNGKIKYWNDDKNRKIIVPKNALGLVKSEKIVPYWKFQYIFSMADFATANSEQQNFYNYFKDCFLNEQYVDSEGNSNYEFILFYNLLTDFVQHKDFEKLENQLKQLGSYYPITSPYAVRTLVQMKLENGNAETAWKLRKSKGDAIQLHEIYKYQRKLGRKLFDGGLISKLVGYSHLTIFGQENIVHIQLMAEKVLEEFESVKGLELFKVFFKIKRLSLSPYEQQYYEQFYLSKEEFEFYKNLDNEQSKQNYFREMPHVAEKAVFSQLRLFLKKAEDLYREEIGMPKVGEGWISETDLYYKITKAFPDYEVIHHGQPKWLRKQHLDIYIPKLSIGVEYQGIQHYKPVKIFGGEQGLAATIERDQRKLNICKENNCTLIFVNEGYNFEKVKIEIQNIIEAESRNYEAIQIFSENA